MILMQLQKIKPPEITPTLINSVVDKIIKHFDPDKIILFGSQVWGDPKRWSDIDLLVIMDYDGFSSQIAANISLDAQLCFS